MLETSWKRVLLYGIQGRPASVLTSEGLAHGEDTAYQWVLENTIGDEMKILITGITGRIGSNVAAKLREDGHDVRGLVWPKDPRIEKLEARGMELMEGSLTESADVNRCVEGVDAIYHLGAAFQGGGPFTESDYFDINIRGTFNVLEAARTNSGLKHLIFASTDAQYAKYPPEGLEEPIREDTMPRQPSGWYALSKSMGEELCNGYVRTFHMPITIIRFCLVVGAGEILNFPQFYLSNLKSRPDMKDLWNGDEKLVLQRDKKNRPFKKHIADVRDIVQGCLDALEKKASYGETIQLGGPKPFTWDETIPYLSEKLDIPYIDVVAQGTPTHYQFDLSKARTLLGFEPQYDIITMIDDALRFRDGEDIGVLPT
jgi:nucleoside-diphosphate-sugar epimerase